MRLRQQWLLLAGSRPHLHQHLLWQRRLHYPRSHLCQQTWPLNGLYLRSSPP